MGPLSEQSTNLILLNSDGSDSKSSSSAVGMCNNRSKPKKGRVPDHPIHVTDLTSQHLQRICGTQDLVNVRQLELMIDSEHVDLDHLTEFLPSLNGLILDSSKIESFRDVGASLRMLCMLSVANCGIRELDGIGILSNLKEISLAHNQISDLTPLAMHEYLEIIDLSYNALEDMNECAMLGTCAKLRQLDMRGNPFSHSQTYRFDVCSHVPQLEVLEGRQVREDLGNKNDATCVVKVKHERQPRNFRHDSEKRENVNPAGVIDIAGNPAKSIMRRRASNNLRRKLKEQLGNETFTFHFRPAELKDEHKTAKSSLTGASNRKFSRRPHTARSRKIQLDGDINASISTDNRPQSASSIRQSNDFHDTINDFMPGFGGGLVTELKKLDVSHQRRSRTYRKAKETVKNIDFDSGSETDSDEDIACLRAEIKELSFQPNL